MAIRLRKMAVIGVTGTKGKTSATNFIWSVLTASGEKTGLISTANIRIGSEEKLNYFHMTMPGRFSIPKIMSQMEKAGCNFCVVEVSSEGIKQWRQAGIDFDVVVFTNLTPEHLPSHEGSFEKYKEAKSRLFSGLSQSFRKKIEGKEVPKIIIANKDSEYADFFLNFLADKKFTFGLGEGAEYRAEKIFESLDGVDFSLDNYRYKLSVPGAFNVMNALPAIIVGKIFDVQEIDIEKGLLDLKTIPGRMERIDEGQNFVVFVDYAHQKESMAAAVSACEKMKKPGSRIIVVLGAEGGGRDKRKRPAMGEIVGTRADFVVVCNVDPYDDEPKQIIEDIAVVAEKFGKVRGENLFAIEDRREGIRQALTLAREGDIVLITGKGAEQAMIVGGKNIPWDDRKVVREELKKL